MTELAGRDPVPVCQLIKKPYFGQRTLALQQMLLQHADLAGIEAVETANGLNGIVWSGEGFGWRCHECSVSEWLTQSTNWGGAVSAAIVAPSRRHCQQRHVGLQRARDALATAGGTLALPRSHLHLAPQLRAWVFRIQLGQFAQQFLGALVARHGDSHGNLDDFIPARAFFCGRRHAFFPQPQLLAGLRPLRDFQQRPAVDGGHLNLRAQGRFGGTDWHRQIDVVAIAPKNGMLLGADDGIQVARRSAARPGVAFARQANALSVAGTGFDPNLERLGLSDRALAVAGRAGREILARPMASRTLHVKLHASAGLRDLTAAAAFGALARRLQLSLPMTLRAN